MSNLRYRRLRLVAFNETPDEENCFHVDAEVPAGVTTHDELFEALIKPMWACMFGVMAEPMPSPLLEGHKWNPAYLEWMEKYHGVSAEQIVAEIVAETNALLAGWEPDAQLPM